MNKKEAIDFINDTLGKTELRRSNTHYARKGTSRNIWWMNIPVEKFKTTDLHIIFIGDINFYWFHIPAKTFMEPEKHFRIWEEKNAVDLLVSSDPRDRFMLDTASGSTGVDFEPFLKKSFPLPSSSDKPDGSEISKIQPEDKLLKQIQSNLKPENRKIETGETNISYKKLFADYLKGATTITLQDPFIRQAHQFENFMEFCQMLGEIKPRNTALDLNIITWNDNEFQERSKSNFQEVATGLKALNINLSYQFQKEHDRFIEADNGWKIVLGRGLDIFQKTEGRFNPAKKDQTLRKCKSCELTYFRH